MKTQIKLSKLEEKIVALSQRGVDVKTIAQKLGYRGAALTVGVQKVKQTLDRLEGREGVESWC